MKLGISASGFTFVIKEFSCNENGPKLGGFVAAALSRHALNAPTTPVLVTSSSNSALTSSGSSSSQTVKILAPVGGGDCPLSSSAALLAPVKALPVPLNSNTAKSPHFRH